MDDNKQTSVVTQSLDLAALMLAYDHTLLVSLTLAPRQEQGRKPYYYFTVSGPAAVAVEATMRTGDALDPVKHTQAELIEFGRRALKARALIQRRITEIDKGTTSDLDVRWQE